MFEQVADHEDIPAEIRTATAAARQVHVGDALLPPESDTIAIDAPDDTGKMVTHEALPPGTVVYLQLRPKSPAA